MVRIYLPSVWIAFSSHVVPYLCCHGNESYKDDIVSRNNDKLAHRSTDDWRDLRCISIDSLPTTARHSTVEYIYIYICIYVCVCVCVSCYCCYWSWSWSSSAYVLHKSSFSEQTYLLSYSDNDVVGWKYNELWSEQTRELQLCGIVTVYIHSGSFDWDEILL